MSATALDFPTSSAAAESEGRGDAQPLHISMHQMTGNESNLVTVRATAKLMQEDYDQLPPIWECVIEERVRYFDLAELRRAAALDIG
jgi:hypothetical protein